MSFLDPEDLALLLLAIELLDQTDPSASTAKVRMGLNGARLGIGAVESHIAVSQFALRAQACDIDCDVAAVLATAVSQLTHACQSVESALDLLQGFPIAPPVQRQRLAIVRDKLRMMAREA